DPVAQVASATVRADLRRTAVMRDEQLLPQKLASVLDLQMGDPKLVPRMIDLNEISLLERAEGTGVAGGTGAREVEIGSTDLRDPFEQGARVGEALCPIPGERDLVDRELRPRGPSLDEPTLERGGEGCPVDSVLAGPICEALEKGVDDSIALHRSLLSC